MKEHYHVLLNLFIVFSFFCCKNENDYFLDALKRSSNNRVELAKVLKKYENDSLKVKAASFLISNMKGLYALDGPSMDKYYSSMDSLKERLALMNVFELRALSDSIIDQLHFSGLEKKYDLNNIGADYLIRRIDHAFKVREMPWAKDLSFEDFCEYLLPYRIGTEVLEDWQEDLGDYFKELLDETDLQLDSAMYMFCDKLSKKYKTNLYAYPSAMPTIKPSRLKYQRIGPCEDFANLFVFIGRTFGIPTAIDFTPQ